MMNDEKKTGSEEAKKSGRAEKTISVISVICGHVFYRMMKPAKHAKNTKVYFPLNNPFCHRQIDIIWSIKKPGKI
jgi:hypothetical protein